MVDISTYQAVATVAEAVQVLSEGDAMLFAGGTDLMPQTQAGLKNFSSTLLNINKIEELHGIQENNGQIHMGALTTVSGILHHPMLKNKVSILAKTADCFASDQLRNQATVGGNICNASPAGDMIIPFLLLNAELELVSWQDGKVSKRVLPLQDFFVGPGKTQLAINELLTYINFAMPTDNFVAEFKKCGLRPALDISIVSVGIAAEKTGDVLQNVRVAFGAVAPTPLMASKTAAALEGQSITEALIETAANVAADEVSPISDVRASAWYRKKMIRTFTERILADVMHERN